MQIRVDIESIKRNGVNKHQRPYFILSGYATLPGVKYPQACEFYSETLHNPGSSIAVPVVASIQDGKVSFACDYSAAQPVAKAS